MKPSKRLSMHGLRARLSLAGLALALALAACGGGGDNPAAPPAPTTYTVGGSVTGLAGSGLVLRNNGSDALAVAGASFTFATALVSGSAYGVTVATQPSNPTQACTVANGSGNVALVNVSTVAVNCTTPPAAALPPKVAYVTGECCLQSTTVDDHLLISYGVNAATGALSETRRSTGADAVSGSLSLDPLMRFAFVDQRSAGLEVHRIDATTGALTLSRLESNWLWGPVTPHPQGRFAYTSSGGLQAFAVDAVSGVLSSVSTPITLPVGSGQPQFHPSGRFVYTASQSRVRGFAIDAASGAATPVAPQLDLPTSVSIRAMAVDPLGRFVHLAVNDTVEVYAIDGASGALSRTLAPFTLPAQALDSLRPMVVDPSGRFLYLIGSAGASNHRLYGFAIDAASGALTLFHTSAVAESDWRNLRVDPSGRTLYAPGNGRVRVFGIHTATGALTTLPDTLTGGGTNQQLHDIALTPGP